MIDTHAAILITGAGGFVGRALVCALAPHRPVIATDSVAPDEAAQGETALAGASQAGATIITGDLGDPAVIAALTRKPLTAIIHLATVPGGAAEGNPGLAARINVAAPMALFDAAAAHGNTPRIVFASSIAVFGNPMPPHVDDSTPVRPIMLYGAHKAMVEEWIATLTRRGAVRGLSLRLPGIVARPLAPSGMKSAFLSNLFHALKAGEPITLPVSADATCWLLSRRALVTQLVSALDRSDDPISTRLNLPALRVRMGDLVAAAAAHIGADPMLAQYDPDPAIEAAFGAQPPLSTPAADAMNLTHDGDLARLVAHGFADIETP